MRRTNSSAICGLVEAGTSFVKTNCRGTAAARPALPALATHARVAAGRPRPGRCRAAAGNAGSGPAAAHFHPTGHRARGTVPRATDHPHAEEPHAPVHAQLDRSEEHTSELQ